MWGQVRLVLALTILTVVLGFVLLRIAELRVHGVNYNYMIVGGAEELIPKIMKRYYQLGYVLAASAAIEKLCWPLSPVQEWQLGGFALLMAAIGLRWWSIQTLGPRWSMRCVSNYGFPVVRRGPYRFFQHPEYLSRTLEAAGICLILGAPFSLLWYLVISSFLIIKIIKVERRQLQEMSLQTSAQWEEYCRKLENIA